MAALLGAARRSAPPVVLIIEDAHHADPGLLDFCEHLLDWSLGRANLSADAGRGLTLSRAAPVGAPAVAWVATPSLDPLDAAAMGRLLDGLVPDMPAAARDAIAGRAEGIPLYAVETVRMLIDRDVVQPKEGVYRLCGDVGELTVPATLHSLLAARLDALESDARRLMPPMQLFSAGASRERHWSP